MSASALARLVAGIGLGIAFVAVPRSSVYGNFPTAGSAGGKIVTEGTLIQDSLAQDSANRGRRGAPSPTTPAIAQALQVPVTGRALPCEGGKAGIFDCRNVDLLSFLPRNALGGDSLGAVSDLWGWTDTATGREFVVLGRKGGTVFVESTDPVNPKYLGLLPPPSTASNPSMLRDIKVYKDHAFIVAEISGAHGMQVFELTQLRTVTDPPKVFQATARYDRFGSTHNLALNEATGFAYALGINPFAGERCGVRMHIIDVRDPVRPTFAGCSNTGGGHDTQCVVYRGPDARYHGRELCFSSAVHLLTISDVTDKSAPKRIGAGEYPNRSLVHQGWLSEDQRYFFVGDEGDESRGTATTRTVVFDVADLEDPVVTAQYFGPTRATDHNLYVRGRYMYQSNYMAGLRVVDISEPTAPKEVGYLDTAPRGEDTPTFVGAFSSYPFFPSGVVAVSSTLEGLFIVRYRSAERTP